MSIEPAIHRDLASIQEKKCVELFHYTIFFSSEFHKIPNMSYMNISIATGERSFSVLKGVQNYFSYMTGKAKVFSNDCDYIIEQFFKGCSIFYTTINIYFFRYTGNSFITQLLFYEISVCILYY